MTRLTVVRNKGWFGRIRTVRLMADDVEVTRIRSGETIHVELPTGAETLYARLDWASTKPLLIKEIEDETTLYLNARFSLNPLRSIGIMPMPLVLEKQPG